MTELVVQIEDTSLLPDIKKAIRLLKGVVKVSAKRRQRSKSQLSGIELGLKDIEEGRVYHAKDVDDLMKQLHAE